MSTSYANDTCAEPTLSGTAAAAAAAHARHSHARRCTIAGTAHPRARTRTRLRRTRLRAPQGTRGEGVGWVSRTTCSGGRRKHTHAYADFVGVIAAAGREDLLAALHGNGGPAVRPREHSMQRGACRCDMRHDTRRRSMGNTTCRIQQATRRCKLCRSCCCEHPTAASSPACSGCLGTRVLALCWRPQAPPS